MSRRPLFAKLDWLDLWVGWDAGGGTFFLQYGDLNDELPLMLHAGYQRGEYDRPDLILALANALAESVPPDLSELLIADQLSEGGRFAEPADEITVAGRGRGGVREIGTISSTKAYADPDAFVELALRFMDAKWTEWNTTPLEELQALRSA